MKIYQHEPTHFVRLQIMKVGEKTQYLTLVETTIKEVEQFVKDTVKDKIDVFANGKMTRVDIRDAIGGTNGKSISVSFKGISTEETLNLITSKITNNDN